MKNIHTLRLGLVVFLLLFGTLCLRSENTSCRAISTSGTLNVTLSEESSPQVVQLNPFSAEI